MRSTTTLLTRFIAASIFVATAAFADPIVYTTESSFLAATAPGYYKETFSVPRVPPLLTQSYSQGGFAYYVQCLETLNTDGLYYSGTFVGASLDYGNVKVFFTSGNAKAVGGFFFDTDLSDLPVANSDVHVTVKFSVGDDYVETVTPGSSISPSDLSSAFRGFVAPAGATITSIELDANSHPSDLYSGLANLTVGNAISGGYNGWKTTKFSPTELANPALEATRWGKLADPDGDNIPNLLEYATGTEPLVTGTGGFSTALSGNFLTLTYTRILDATLIYTVEGSSDLVSWTTVSVANNPSTGAQNVSGQVTITDTVSTASGRRFLRLKVGN
jgi:hypothetical protein